MKILNENARWWKGIEKEWAVQDKSGNWWLYSAKDSNLKMKMPRKKRVGEQSLMLTKEYCIIIALASALGISLALNIITLLI
jgi:hypothetical protein